MFSSKQQLQTTVERIISRIEMIIRTTWKLRGMNKRNWGSKHNWAPSTERWTTSSDAFPIGEDRR